MQAQTPNRALLIGIVVGLALACLLCVVLPTLAAFGGGFVQGFGEAIANR